MADMIRILLVDDKEDYCESLVGVAGINDLEVVYALDWETGFDLLKKDSRIEFVILDGKGKIEADQEREKGNFVIRAMHDLNAWNHQQKKHIPFCVNTGFLDNFENLEENVEVFEKNARSRDRMFRYIREEVEKSEYRTAKLLFPEPFEVFDKAIIDFKYQHLLLDLIKCHQKGDYRKKNISVQRDLWEALLWSLNSPIPCIPDALYDRKPNHESCTRFLEKRAAKGSDKKYYELDVEVPDVMKGALRKLKESVNQYSHLDDEEILKYPFLSNFYLLMEVLCWLPEFVDEHYKNYI